MLKVGKKMRVLMRATKGASQAGNFSCSLRRAIADQFRSSAAEEYDSDPATTSDEEDGDAPKKSKPAESGSGSGSGSDSGSEDEDKPVKEKVVQFGCTYFHLSHMQ